LIDLFILGSSRRLRTAMPGNAVSASRQTVLGLANAPYFIMWPWPATSSTTCSGFYLRLCTYPFLEVLSYLSAWLIGSRFCYPSCVLIPSVSPQQFNLTLLAFPGVPAPPSPCWVHMWQCVLC